MVSPHTYVHTESTCNRLHAWMCGTFPVDCDSTLRNCICLFASVWTPFEKGHIHPRRSAKGLRHFHASQVIQGSRPRGRPDRGLFGFTLRVIIVEKAERQQISDHRLSKSQRKRFMIVTCFDIRSPYITHLCELYSTRLCKKHKPTVICCDPLSPSDVHGHQYEQYDCQHSWHWAVL